MLNVGDIVAIQRTFSTKDLLRYQEISKTPSTSKSVPEPLIGNLFSYLLGEELPGYGTNYLKQEMASHHAAPVNENLRAEVEIVPEFGGGVEITQGFSLMPEDTTRCNL